MHTILQNIARQLTYDPHNPLIFSSGLFMALFVGFTLVYYLLRNKLTPRILFVTLFSYYFTKPFLNMRIVYIIIIYHPSLPVL